MKKQITINGEKSDWFEKATFVLKEENEKKIPKNLFIYAEHLVENYLKRHSGISYSQTEAYKKQMNYIKPKDQALKQKHEEKKKETAIFIDMVLLISLFAAFVCIGLLVSEIWL